MLIEISTIAIDPGRRAALPEDVQKMADSMAEIGLVNPITIDKRHTLIAGLHRLEAAKLLGWTKIECNVSDLEGLAAELAEIDENFVRCELPTIEHNDVVLRRKELYEALHPSTKNGGDRRSEKCVEKNRTTKCRSDTGKAFTQDTASKMNVSPRTVERQVQAAKNTTEKAKKILRASNINITQQDALKLSRLEPEQQVEVATLLVDGKIRKVGEYTATQFEAEPDVPPFQIGGKQFSTFKEGVADLKNTEKDFRCTPDDFLAEVTAFVRKFQREIEWYNTPYYEEVYPALSSKQLAYLRRQTDLIRAAADQFYNNVTKGRQ